jgi:LysM repeat protein
MFTASLLAKAALIAVVSLSHNTVTVQPGMTLSGVAAEYQVPGGWQQLCADNHLADCNLIYAGQVIRLGTAADAGGLLPAPEAAPATAPAQSAQPVSAAPGSFQACVITRESGGQPQVMNSSGHYGLYQFSASTWASAGGNPSDFGHASIAEQNQVFASAYALYGTQPWAPSDHC